MSRGWKVTTEVGCVAAPSLAALTRRGPGPLPRQQTGPGDHTWNKQGAITTSPEAVRRLGSQGLKANACGVTTTLPGMGTGDTPTWDH